jgi:hypothetical protein
MTPVDVSFQEAVIFSRASQAVAVAASHTFGDKQKGKGLCAMLRDRKYCKHCFQ